MAVYREKLAPETLLASIDLIAEFLERIDVLAAV
ncbi:hypothetical protein A4R44_04509 [Amycolatopsis sp. M39]|uniref:Uncharacterized protein n=1 Tax=Amycolatopsis rubida TaxID=112413 RepID=A0A1I5D7B7_9PSEU|nr:hypothetical protein A4R44_04509 [Amycolatopsis sp. M39]SFN95047.1 hypothetical protein SAMN05421854_101122 [Amycolatopsis rubida]